MGQTAGRSGLESRRPPASSTSSSGPGAWRSTSGPSPRSSVRSSTASSTPSNGPTDGPGLRTARRPAHATPDPPPPSNDKDATTWPRTTDSRARTGRRHRRRHRGTSVRLPPDRMGRTDVVWWSRPAVVGYHLARRRPAWASSATGRHPAGAVLGALYSELEAERAWPPASSAAAGDRRPDRGPHGPTAGAPRPTAEVIDLECELISPAGPRSLPRPPRPRTWSAPSGCPGTGRPTRST